MFLTLQVTAAMSGFPVALSAATISRLPPLEIFFAEPARFSESIRPDGSRVAYLGPDNAGVNRLWIVRTDSPETPVRVSQPAGPAVSAFSWIADDSILWQTSGSGGRVRLFLGGPDDATVREILPDERRVMILEGIVNSAATCLLVGLSDGPSAFPDLYRVALRGNDKPELVCANRYRIITWAWDRSGVPVAGLRWTDEGAKEILKLRDGIGTVVFRAEAADDARLLFASEDGFQVFVLTNRDSDVTRLERVDLVTGKRQMLASDPLDKVDVDQIVADAGQGKIMAVGYTDENTRWQALDPEFGILLETLGKVVDPHRMTILGFDSNRNSYLLKLFSDREPGTIYLYDVGSRSLRVLWHDLPEMDRSTLCETKAVRYPARDASLIPAFLTLPRNAKPPLPLVVFPHGGPRMRTSPGFDGRVQFLASRGYAVLQPNFRGSRGYGKSFMNAGDGQWGKGLMQTDVTDGVDHLVSEGVADKGRVAILGGSYGGYAVLAGLTFSPDRYAAGICLFGISDLLDYADFSPTEWLPYAADRMRRLGDPYSAAGRAFLADLSPVNHASSVTSPLLIYHGANDNLIPVSHARRMTTALLRSGKRVEFLLAADEAHGFSQPQSEMAVYRAIEIFLSEQIGGQVGKPPCEPVRRKLAEFHSAGHAYASKCLDVPSCRPPP